jgi:ATP-dependent Lon protease
MRDFRDAKAMAQTLREALKTKSVSLTHSESLELVAKMLGLQDWNVLAARIPSEDQPEARPSTASNVPRAVSAGPLPVIPIRDLVLFPDTIVPLFVGRESSKRAVENAMVRDQRFVAVTQRAPGDDNPATDALYSTGVTANLLDVVVLPDETMKLVVKGLERVSIVNWIEGPFLAAEVATLAQTRGEGENTQDLSRKVLEAFQARLKVDLSTPAFRRLSWIREPGALADALAPFLPIEIAQRQDLLATSDVITRLEKMLALMRTDQQAA